MVRVRARVGVGMGMARERQIRIHHLRTVPLPPFGSLMARVGPEPAR
jgi:hypothetical protein